MGGKGATSGKKSKKQTIPKKIMSFSSRQEAIDYLSGLKMTNKKLRDLSLEMGYKPMNGMNKNNLIRSLVNFTLGAKLKREAINEM